MVELATPIPRVRQTFVKTKVKMKAILLNKAGTIDNLQFQDIEKPILKKGEVLVKIKAISINPADVLCRAHEEFLNFVLGEQRPVILGWDIAGDIVEKAADTDGFELGDAVFAFLDFFKGGKGYAEYVAIRTDLLAHKPANVSYAEAAAITMCGLTAWQPLFEQANIKKGDRVLIHGASGGIGHLAVQLAKYLGATVIASSSGKNREFVLSLGADQHIDYQATQPSSATQPSVEALKLSDQTGNIDFVLDPIGGETLDQSIDVVKENGKIITLLPTLSEEVKAKAARLHVNLAFMASHPNGKDLGFLAGLLSNGTLRAHISATYPFAEMGKAHTQLETRHTVGKVVVTL
jgi:NADPH:quinone reductase-like Zn-dependent oxidoreductase